MNILTINCGSSSLKFQLFEAAADGSARTSAHGTVDRIGAGGAIEFQDAAGRQQRETVAVPDHGDAARRVLAWLGAVPLTAVAHRVVHGGDRFVQPARIDDAVLAEIDALSELAPLHNLPALAAIRAARAALGPELPMFAVFDTAFHRTMPAHAARYAIPHELADKYRIQRYGFHGLAHRAMAEAYFTWTKKPVAGSRLITLQLGNGCSAAAVADGRSVDTTMGFTPLEGLVMGTRCGDLDPALVPWLARAEGCSAELILERLNRDSGLLGLSGVSGDMREIERLRAAGDPRASLAFGVFVHRARRHIAAAMASLGGADLLVFSGGIGENSPLVRATITDSLAWCGVRLDPQRNAEGGLEATISTEDSPVRVQVIGVDEESPMARAAARAALAD